MADTNAQYVTSYKDKLCPLCCTSLGYDGKTCVHCGMEITGFTKTHFQFVFYGSVVNYFSNPNKLIDPSDILDDKSILPDDRGLYGWYFDSVPEKLPQNLDYIKVENRYLLYIGIAGKHLNQQGNLRERIVSNHLKGNYNSSTLAKSLHAILNIPKEDIDQRKKWMLKHLKVAFITHPNPDPIETFIIKKYGHILPLNLEKNPKNPFGQDLENLRKMV